MSDIDYGVQGQVAVIAFGDPPVNSLGHLVRRALVAALDRAILDPAVSAIVLTGRNGLYSGGADIREFGTPDMLRAPNLRQVIAAVEGSPKPVVAAVSGICLGGGFELALGCHHRVAAADASLGLPEVKIGLLPGAGGTQRLPRLVGVETALNIILSGEPVPAKLLARTPLLDRTVEGDPLAAAIDLATSVAARGAPPRRTRDLEVREPNLEALCEFARTTVKATFPHLPAPQRCADAVQACSEPFEEGLQIERALFVQLLESPEAKSLRHAFFAERAAGKITDVPADTATRPIRSAAVIGAGTMGGGITMSLVNAGIPVKVLEAEQAALERGLGVIRRNYESAVKKGKITAQQLEERMALIEPTLDYGALGTADIVIEAVFEDMEVKRAVFAKLDATMKPGAILASNTSTLDLNRIAATTDRPQDVIGTHFFSPANIMRLLEVVRGEATGKDVLASVMALARRIKKVAVVSGVCDGFIGNRMVEQYLRQALFMVEEGASPREVDAAMEAFGFAMGPFRMSDLAGNDIGWHIRKRRYVERPDMKYPKLADELCELGRFGQKSGAGWYDYAAGDRTPRASKNVDELIAAHRKRLGITVRKIEATEIVDRLVYALVNEGARILEEKIAQRASDIDVVYVNGYGFPVWHGGPMFHADLVGLFEVVRRMKQFAGNPHGDPAFWTPAPLLARLAETGGTFNATNTGAA
jgi:3-hydroxyacyl-CoA dehydrogenase